MVRENLRQHKDFLIEMWNSEEVSNIPDDRKWWEIWKYNPSKKVENQIIARFLIEAIDDMTGIVVKEVGPDLIKHYKTDIMVLFETLLNEVVVYPWWAKPFKGLMNDFILTLASLFINFLLQKYAEGKIKP